MQKANVVAPLVVCATRPALKDLPIGADHVVVTDDVAVALGFEDGRFVYVTNPGSTLAVGGVLINGGFTPCPYGASCQICGGTFEEYYLWLRKLPKAKS